MAWRDDRILALDSDGALYLVAATPPSVLNFSVGDKSPTKSPGGPWR